MRIFILSLVLALSLKSAAQSQLTIAAVEKLANGQIEAGMSSLQSAARTNDIAAQFFLGLCYEHGRYVGKNVSQAFMLYRKTAERGLADGMYKLAECYEKGIGVEINPEAASRWRERFNTKGGKLVLPDFIEIYDKAVALSASNTQPATYASPSGTTNNAPTQNHQTINNITIVQPSTVQHDAAPASNIKKPDVDTNIPVNKNGDENLFALIIANENYQDVAKVPNALNDGDIFAEYCRKTLGLHESNVHLVKDATLNNIKREINQIRQIAEAYKGEARFIFYYAGHGIPDEKSRDAYLLPVDGYGTDISTAYSLNELYATLGKLPAKQVVILLDACFSGSLRGDGMMAAARGVAIKAKSSTPTGNMIVLSAAQGNETAYPYKEQQHGLFTYYLLKKLQESSGGVTLDELSRYIQENVSKKSIVVNGKSQTPVTSVSPTLGDGWKQWTLK